MSLHNRTNHVLRALSKLPRQYSTSKCLLGLLPASSRPASARGRRPEVPHSPLDPITLHRLEEERRAYYKRRFYISVAGVLFGMAGIWFTATSIRMSDPPSKAESPSERKDDPLVVIGRDRKIIVHKLGEEPEDVPDVVVTGTSTVPTFPRLLEFADTIEAVEARPETVYDDLVEYQLVGLGIRTVSFLAIQVYVVGMYVATDDIATLQEALIRRIDPIATTLVAGEKTKLRNVLLDPERGEEVWSEILRDTAVRTLMRIVPTRDTDFGHLRDGWVRAITAKAKKNNVEFGDETFGASVNNFKAVFRKGSVPKKKELLLARDQKGVLTVWYDDGKAARRLGDVQDERISRAVWLNYLAGKSVASEPARQSIVSGIMEYVARPIGSVGTQIHV